MSVKGNNEKYILCIPLILYSCITHYLSNRLAELQHITRCTRGVRVDFSEQECDLVVVIV